MANLLKQFSLMPRGVRYKLGVAFFLMALIPLFVCAFFILAYIYPETRYSLTIGTIDLFQIQVIMTVTVGITVLGFILVMREIIGPFVRISAKAKRVAEGHLEIPFEADREDEVGELGESLNRMTSRIKETINELRAYGEKTKQINIEIHKKVLALSNLLQIGNLISGGTALQEVVAIVTEKLLQSEMADRCFIYLVEEGEGPLALRASQGGGADVLPSRVEIGKGFLGKIASHAEPLMSDAKTSNAPDTKEFKYNFGVQNLAILPVTARGAVVGLLGIGNSLENFHFSSDELEVVKVFAKQVSIAVENNLLSRRAKELQVKDELTKLYNETFTRQRLEEEIKRAMRYQRPCSFILFDIDDFGVLEPSFQSDLLKQFARTLESNVTETDRAARFDRDLFAVILPERNKKEATQLAEGLRQKVEREFAKGGSDRARKITISAGVSENPIDGATAEALFQKAKDALSNAKALGKNRVVA